MEVHNLPYTLNGIGTWYYGKKNVHTYQGVCPHCGTYNELTSYDTTKFFVFLLIPIIPLGDKRVIGQCRGCSKHHVMKLKDWKRFTKEKIDSLHSKWLLNPQNKEDTLELIHSIIDFRDADKLNLIAKDIKTYCYSDAEVLNQLGLAYSFFNLFEEAISAFNASFSLNQNSNTKENLAEALMKSLKPDEARPLLKHILDYRIANKVHYIYLLIESYQYTGNHTAALEIIESCENAFPELKDKKQLQTYRKNSQRHLNSSRKIRGAFIPVKSPDKQYLISYKLVFPFLLFLGVSFYLLIAFLMGLSTEVYLVNGLDKAYSVEIEGKRIELEPMTQKMVHLREGELEIDISELNSDQKKITVDIRTPFLMRPISNRVLVINPDKVAVLLWQETLYTTKKETNTNYDYPYLYYAGQHFYNIYNVDYVFEDFPETISMIENSTMTQSQLIQLNKDDLSPDYWYVLEGLSQEDAKSYVKARLSYEPDNYIDLNTYLSLCDTEEAIIFLREKLDDRPILINWHRAYQDYMEVNEPTYDLKKEYSSYLENEKDSKVFYYLLGRLSEDPKEEEQLFKQSIEGEDPVPYGYYALANHSFYNGDYEQALLYALKAVDLLPNDYMVKLSLEDILMAKGEYNLLLETNQAKQSIDPMNGILVAEEVKLYMAQKDVTSAQNAIANYLKRIDSYDQETVQIWNTYLHGLLAYYQNDGTTYADSLKEMESPVFTFQNAFINKDLDKASQVALDNDLDGSYFLLLYLAQDNPTSASKYLSQAIYAYQQGGKTYQLLADYLLQKQNYTLAEMKALAIHPSEKCIVMAALGKLNPAYEKELLDYAEKLNYDIDFPYHFINKIVEDNK